MSDFALYITPDGYADLLIANNDIAVTDSLQPAFIICLACDALAPADAVIPDGSTNRRGYWGDTYPDIPNDNHGSLIWLRMGSDHTDATLQQCIADAQAALQVLVTTGLVTSLTVTGQWTDNNSLLLTLITPEYPPFDINLPAPPQT